jgi:hypothetical protein
VREGAHATRPSVGAMPQQCVQNSMSRQTHTATFGHEEYTTFSELSSRHNHAQRRENTNISNNVGSDIPEFFEAFRHA